VDPPALRDRTTIGHRANRWLPVVARDFSENTTARRSKILRRVAPTRGGSPLSPNRKKGNRKMTPNQQLKRTFDKMVAPVDLKKRELMRKVSELPSLRKAAAIGEELADVLRRIGILERQTLAARPAPPSAAWH